MYVLTDTTSTHIDRRIQTEKITGEEYKLDNETEAGRLNIQFTVKSIHATTSIKQSPVLKGHLLIFLSCMGNFI